MSNRKTNFTKKSSSKNIQVKTLALKFILCQKRLTKNLLSIINESLKQCKKIVKFYSQFGFFTECQIIALIFCRGLPELGSDELIPNVGRGVAFFADGKSNWNDRNKVLESST